MNILSCITLGALAGLLVMIIFSSIWSLAKRDTIRNSGSEEYARGWKDGRADMKKWMELNFSNEPKRENRERG